MLYIWVFREKRTLVNSVILEGYGIRVLKICHLSENISYQALYMICFLEIYSLKISFKCDLSKNYIVKLFQKLTRWFSF